MSDDNLLIDLAILQALEASGKYLMGEDTLRMQVKLKLAAKPMDSEIDRRLRYLDSQGRVVFVKGEYRNSYKLSAAGKAWLIENGF